MAAMNINSKKFKEMIENGKTFLVDFWAPWCPHCRKINPAYEQIAEQYAGVLEVVKVNMDEDDKLWSELQVELIPTLRLYVDGKPIASTVAPESNVAIEEFLSGIRVNAVAPGITETDMMKAVPKEVIDPMIAQIPLKRLGQPEDIANAFAFLASDEASYITGVVLSVDGMART